MTLRDGSGTIASPVGLSNAFPRLGAAFPGCLAGGGAGVLIRFGACLGPLARAGCRLARGFLELLAPGFCRACEARVPEPWPLCPTCAAGIVWHEASCYRCGNRLPAAARARTHDAGRAGALPERVRACAACSGQSWAFDGVLAAGDYSGPLRRLILSYKFEGDRGVLPALVDALEGAYLEDRPFRGAGAARGAVTSVPQHAWRRFVRGWDPAAELASRFAARIGWPYRRFLAKRRWTCPQVLLPRAARRSNLKGSFGFEGKAAPPARVLLVDDVLTTGSTLSECAAVLRQSGCREVIAVVVARSAVEV
jgi:ComF family protein